MFINRCRYYSLRSEDKTLSDSIIEERIIFVLFNIIIIHHSSVRSCPFVYHIFICGSLSLAIYFPFSSYPKMAQPAPPPRVSRTLSFFCILSLTLFVYSSRHLLINHISMLFEQHFKQHFVLKILNHKLSNVIINLKLKSSMFDIYIYFFQNKT
jgi:hypothetical protein